MDTLSKRILKAVLSLPTMSFHEAAVREFVTFYAEGLGLKVRKDRAGNVIVRYKYPKAGGGKTNVVFTAHTDHPGFEVVSSKGKDAIVSQWGRVRLDLIAGANVVVRTREGGVKGRIGKKPIAKKVFGRACFKLRAESTVRRGDFGYLDLPAVKFRDGLVHTRTADDLVCVAAILDLATRLVRKKARADFTAIFTACEEPAAMGAIAAMEFGSVPRGAPVVILECSSASGGGVTIGAGPVIRTGDKTLNFDAAIEAWMRGRAEEVSSKSRGFVFQRALLQGGACEASRFVAFGYPTGGIALPLGNYHNQGLKRYAMEYVSAKDYENLLVLLAAVACEKMPRDVMGRKRRQIEKSYRRLRAKFLKSR